MKTDWYEIKFDIFDYNGFKKLVENPNILVQSWHVTVDNTQFDSINYHVIYTIYTEEDK